MADTQITIGLYQTVPVVPIQTLIAGTTTYRITTTGNSILSTIFVRAATGTVLAKWFDYGASNDEEVAARTELASHPVLSANSTSRIVVSRIHNNARLEITVAGGTAEVAVLGTIVSDFPMNAGILDGQLANLASDGGLPIAIYDTVQGKFFLLRGSGGALAVDPEGTGEGLVKDGFLSLPIAPAVAATVLSETVPAGKTWRLRSARAACGGYGEWNVYNGAVRIGGGRTSPAQQSDTWAFPAGTVATSGQTITILYTYNHGPASTRVDAFLGVTEI